MEEVELCEIRKTDSQKTDGLEIGGFSQDPHDEEKVISIVEKTKFIFDPLMFYNDQANIESVAEVELGEIRKTDSQKTDGLEIFGVSEDPHDEAKVISIVKNKVILFTL